MKKIKAIMIFSVVLVLYSSIFTFADTTFSGSLNTLLTSYIAIPYEDDRFDSLLNPGNFLQVHDLQLTQDFTLKIEGSDDTSAFSLWCGFNTYQIAQALLAAATGNPTGTATLSETLPLLGTQINTIELLRANISFYVTDMLQCTIGRQQMHTGYGYGWNPTDFANPLKDPYDPDAELKGIDAAKMTLAFGNVFSTSVCGLFTGDAAPTGVEFKNIMLLSENTLWLPGMEITLNGCYEYDEDEEEDTIPTAIGAGLKFNLFDIGFYGEGAARFGSRNRYYDTPVPGASIIKTDILPSILGGIEYTFPNELMLVLEYFYNGEGLSSNEKDYYEQNVVATGIPTSGQISMIIPGYVNYHYILCHLFYPLYDLNMDLSLLTLYSPDGYMLNVLPGIVFNLTGSLSVSLGYTGLFTFDKNILSEATLSPVKHIIEIKGQYFF